MGFIEVVRFQWVCAKVVAQQEDTQDQVPEAECPATYGEH